MIYCCHYAFTSKVLVVIKCLKFNRHEGNERKKAVIRDFVNVTLDTSGLNCQNVADFGHCEKGSTKAPRWQFLQLNDFSEIYACKLRQKLIETKIKNVPSPFLC